MRTVIETAEGVRDGRLTAVEVLEECLAAIEAGNAELNAFIHLDADLARRDAQRIDALVAAGEDPGPLAGVPFGVKDLDDCAGMPTGRGSLWYSGGPPVADDSIHVHRLRRAGAVPVGKTAVPEFGFWAYTNNRVTGVTRNPWNLARTPGGSSGGSAAAVSAGLVPFATASDGGGSTRTPAGFCGLVGHKPSFGRIPDVRGTRYGQTAAAGALATTVADAARLLDVMAGPHGQDRTSLPPAGVVYEQQIERLPTTGLRVGWSVDLGFAIVDPEVAAVTEAAANAVIADVGVSNTSIRSKRAARSISISRRRVTAAAYCLTPIDSVRSNAGRTPGSSSSARSGHNPGGRPTQRSTDSSCAHVGMRSSKHTS
ncbi:MAG: amidase, partial [Ilumatobacteraceae bacterium]